MEEMKEVLLNRKTRNLTQFDHQLTQVKEILSSLT